MSLELQIIICSTRPGRVGPTVARWFHGFSLQHGRFHAKLIDLCDFKLSLFDEPNHPRLQKYEHEHTKRWSASVATADAFVFVTPEYNYCPPPGFGNALNYLYNEWNYKACGFVSYAGPSGGLRAVQLEKQLEHIDDPAVLTDVVAHTCLQDSEQRQEVFEVFEVPIFLV